ncbi:MAG: acetamidase/formamidase family protein [Vulcanimicrobiaceae bacterium]|jgi:formamidase
MRISINRDLPLGEEPNKGHNRWHPDIPAIATVRPGESVAIDTRDALNGQVKPGMVGADIEKFAVNVAHPLTGPLAIEGAKPGDLLAVHIEKIDPQPRGYTSFRGPDFGFLRDVFNYKYLVHWEIEGELARSPQIPGVAIPGAPFMGVMGVAPSHELMKTIVAREAELAAKGHLVALPDSRGAVPAKEPLASTALRTIPPREHGGNFDIKQLTAGTTLFLPVFVEGANFSTGDAHFAQGDGESCGTAVEMAATLHARFEVLSGEAARRGQTEPSYAGTYAYDSARMQGKHYYATTGSAETMELSARKALLAMIDYIVDARGYTRDQAYCICSVAVDLHLSQIVDMPNYTVSAFLPFEIFE